MPPNVHVTGWIPIDRALSHVDAFVHHGGAGGLLQALAAGVPQLAVPGSAGRRHNAELLAHRGAGRHEEYDEHLDHGPRCRSAERAMEDRHGPAAVPIAT